MASTNKTVIAFDLYGTLLSTESIAKELASHFGDERAKSLAALWRRYQLEYTWRMNSMGLYRNFSEITLKSLHHALSESALTLSPKDINDLMRAYDNLGTFPDVEAGLTALAQDSSIDAYVFSNGSDAMVSSSVKHSPGLSRHASVFKDLITVEDIRAFKPVLMVYTHLAKQVGKSAVKEDMASMWLVSGNPFDIVGSRAAGMQAAWVDRQGTGWHDRLGELAEGGPTIIVKGVDEVVAKIKKWTENNAKDRQ